MENSFDVLVQYLVTRAVGEGFRADELYQEVNRLLTPFVTVDHAEQWQWALRFVTTGGESLGEYDEFSKVIIEDDIYKVTNRRTAMRHRLSMGTIVSDPMMRVKFVSGGHIGMIEESFAARLKKGDKFWFAGRNLRLERIKDMTVMVSKARGNDGLVPRWSGGRLPLSSQLAEMIRLKLDHFIAGNYPEEELHALAPLLELQQEWSALRSAVRF